MDSEPDCEERGISEWNEDVRRFFGSMISFLLLRRTVKPEWPFAPPMPIWMVTVEGPPIVPLG